MAVDKWNYALSPWNCSGGVGCVRCMMWFTAPQRIYIEKRLYQNVGTRKITYIEKRNAAARPCSHKAAAAAEVKFIKSRKVMSF